MRATNSHTPIDPADGMDRSREDENPAWMQASYVQSVLFGKRRMQRLTVAAASGCSAAPLKRARSASLIAAVGAAAIARSA